MSDADFTPVAQPDVGHLEQQYVSDAITSTWVGPTGEYVDRFRREFAELAGVRHAIPVSNGTVALHVALVALGVGPGDEVIVPSLTYISSVNAVTYCGATPVFADVEPDSWGLDAESVEAAITPRTKAIIAVHLYGMPATMAALHTLAHAYGLALVEDAAEAPFATYQERPTGSLGDVATFSFFGNKVVTCGEGGAVTTNDDALAARIELLRGQGMSSERRYWFPVVGYNYRLTNVAAAMLCAQLQRRNELVAGRWAVYEEYDWRIDEIDGLSHQLDLSDRTRTPWLYPLLVGDDYGESRDALMARLAAAGVETRPFFIPVHTMPPYAELAEQQGHPLPVTDDLASRGMNLPTFRGLPLDELERIVALLRERP
jgi:perosamine synthetase